MPTSDYVFYHYTPSLAAAAVTLSLFTLTTTLHCIQLGCKRSWFLIPLLLGGLCEVVGYVGRLLNAIEGTNSEQYSLAPYILQSLLPLIAPILFSASLYMQLGHIITATDVWALCPLRQRVLTKIFVLGDLISFMIQLTGASLMTKPDPGAATASSWIVIGGLVVQLCFFGYFVVLAIMWNKRVFARDNVLSPESVDCPWRKHLGILYAASALVMVRSIYRVVEYATGQNGSFRRSEVWFYVFDAALMLGVLVLLNIVHLSGVVAGNTRSGLPKFERAGLVSGSDEESG